MENAVDPKKFKSFVEGILEHILLEKGQSRADLLCESRKQLSFRIK